MLHPTLLQDKGHMTELCVKKARTQLSVVSLELKPGAISLHTREVRFGFVDQIGTLGNILPDILA